MVMDWGLVCFLKAPQDHQLKMACANGGCKLQVAGRRPLFMFTVLAIRAINVKPQGEGGGGGGGRADPGKFDIFMEARVKFPTPRHLLDVNFPPLG